MEKITSVYRWLLLLMLSFILVFLLASLANRKNASAKFEQNFSEFKKNDKYALLIDSSFYQLLTIENNLQLFAITKKQHYYDGYLSSLHKMGVWIDSLDFFLKQHERKSDINKLLQQKLDHMNVFLSLKMLNDSLINYASRLQVNTDFNRFKPVFSQEDIRHLESVYITSTKDIVPVKTNKKLFGRLKDAISNKRLEFDTVLNSKIQAQSNNGNDEYWINNARKAENIKKYNLVLNRVVERLVANHSNLQSKQTELFINNSLLLSRLKDSFRILKNLDVETYNTEKLKEEAQKNLNVIEKFHENLMVISVFLVLIILLNIWSLFKNEKKLKQAKEIAVKQTKIKTDFLAQMSHEIRTPLNSIIGFSEQLEKSELTAEQRNQLVSVQSSSQILLSIVNDILDLSKIETGKLNIQDFPFYPKKTIDDIVATLKIHADKKKLAIVVNTDFDEYLQLSGDEYRLKQVIINLVNNAIKFTKKGNIVINAFVSTDLVLRVEVIDSGIGIEKENLEVIFDEFTQIINKNDVNRHNGTGLGLPICKKIIEAQHGFISLESEAGKGSKFFFEVPYKKCSRPGSKIKKPTFLEQNADFMSENLLRNKRILVADDNQMNILLLKAIFRKWGVTYDEARDGVEALSLFQKREYDILLTDIQMPNLDGIELAKEIRNYPEKRKSRLPIVAITANSVETNEVAYRNAGIDDCLVKPFKEETLYWKILKQLN